MTVFRKYLKPIVSGFKLYFRIRELDNRSLRYGAILAMGGQLSRYDRKQLRRNNRNWMRLVLLRGKAKYKNIKVQ